MTISMKTQENIFTIRNNDESVKLEMLKNGNLKLVAGTPRDVIRLIFEYFFFAPAGKEARKSNSDMHKLIINDCLILDYKTYTIEQLKGTPPPWWDELQKERDRFIKLIPFM